MSKQFTQEEYDAICRNVNSANSPLEQVTIAVEALFYVLQLAEPRPEIPYSDFVKVTFSDILAGIMNQIAEIMHESICPGCKAGKGCGSNTIH